MSPACQERHGGPKGRPWYTGPESYGGEQGHKVEDTERREDDGNMLSMFFMSYIM